MPHRSYITKAEPLPFEIGVKKKGGTSRSDGAPMPAQRCPLLRDPPRLFIGQFARSLENLLEHPFGQLASLGVLIGGVVGR